jgi:hypothetical protein
MYDLIQKSFRNFNQDMDTVLSKNLRVTADDDCVAFFRGNEHDDNGECSYSGAHIFLDTIEARKLRDFLNFALQD